MRNGIAASLLLVLGLSWAVGAPTILVAQNGAGVDPYTNQFVEQVVIRIANPSADAGVNTRVEDQLRTLLGLFPGDRFSEERLAFQLSQARRIRDVAGVGYDLGFGIRSGLLVTVNVTLGDTPSEGRGVAFGGDFPTLYEKDGTYVRARLDLLALYYANNNAWYGQPDAMLAGNPLVQGTPAGEGFTDWLEAYAHYGIYGITPVTPRLYLYGGLSAISSGSAGQELFTAETRAYTGLEDAYLGVVGGRTDAAGNRFAYNLSVGRQRFTLANGFLIANTAANGQDRAALQSNARWSSDFLGLAQVRYNNAKIELFYVDPDELPVLDTGTVYVGANLEMQPADGLSVGLSYVTSPSSEAQYFVFDPATGAPRIETREGLEVYDARFTYSPNPAGQAGPFFGAGIRHPAQPQLRHGCTRRLDRSGLQPAVGEMVALRQLPARRVRRRRSRHRDLRALGLDAVGRHRRAMGAGRQPFQGRAGFERDRAPHPGALASESEGRDRPAALGLLRRQRDEHRREPGADISRRRRIRLRGQCHRQVVRQPQHLCARPSRLYRAGRRYAGRTRGRREGLAQRHGLRPLRILNRERDMDRRDMLIGGAAAAAGIGAKPASVQGEARVPDIGPYAEPWNPADPDIPARRNISKMPDDYFTPGRFAGKTVVVTGCARGMGRGAATRLAREGANVVGIDWLEDEGRATMEAIAAEGFATRFVAGDVGEDGTCARMIEVAVEAFGGIDAALNNAGVMDGVFSGEPVDFATQKDLVFAPLHEATDAYWDNVFRTNVKGVFLSMRHELRRFLAQGRGGSIVNVGSIAGLTGLAGNPAYVASKHAVNGITRNAAVDYAPYGVRVNSVNMAATDTPMVARAGALVTAQNAASGPNPGMGRLKTTSILAYADQTRRPATVAEQVSMMVYLLSPESGNMTGATYATDGGWTAF